MRGSAAMLLVFAVFISVFFLWVVPTVTAQWKAHAELPKAESAYVDEIAQRLAIYYRRNAAAIDAAPAYAIVPATLWAELGIDPKPTLRLGISDRLTGTNVRFRRFAVWLKRAEPDASAMNAATGTFTPGPGVVYRVVDGEPIQAALYDETLTRMKAFAVALEKRFRAKFESDPFKSLSVNHFRPAGGTCTVGLDDIPCIDAHTDVLVAANFSALLSLDSSRLVTAWGPRFTVSNLADSQAASPPFTMAVRGALPWGGSVLVNAVQPLN